MSLSYVVPTVGQPDSTEDPKIVTALSSTLSWSAGVVSLKGTFQTGGTYTAADGDLVEAGAAGAATYTLPNVAAAHSVGFTNFSGHAVTVQQAGGTTINGPGLASVTQFSLSQQGAFIVLVSDQANWFVVAGGQDTGWVTLTLAGWTPGPVTPAYRKVQDRVYLRGQCNNTPGGGSSFATLPAGFRPSTAEYVSCAYLGDSIASDSGTGLVEIDTGGVITAYIPTVIASGFNLSLDNVSFSVA